MYLYITQTQQHKYYYYQQLLHRLKAKEMRRVHLVVKGGSTSVLAFMFYSDINNLFLCGVFCSCIKKGNHM